MCSQDSLMDFGIDFVILLLIELLGVTIVPILIIFLVGGIGFILYTIIAAIVCWLGVLIANVLGYSNLQGYCNNNCQCPLDDLTYLWWWHAIIGRIVGVVLPLAWIFYKLRRAYKDHRIANKMD